MATARAVTESGMGGELDMEPEIWAVLETVVSGLTTDVENRVAKRRPVERRWLDNIRQYEGEAKSVRPDGVRRGVQRHSEQVQHLRVQGVRHAVPDRRPERLDQPNAGPGARPGSEGCGPAGRAAGGAGQRSGRHGRVRCSDRPSRCPRPTNRRARRHTRRGTQARRTDGRRGMGQPHRVGVRG